MGNPEGLGYLSKPWDKEEILYYEVEHPPPASDYKLKNKEASGRPL